MFTYANVHSRSYVEAFNLRSLPGGHAVLCGHNRRQLSRVRRRHHLVQIARHEAAIAVVVYRQRIRASVCERWQFHHYYVHDNQEIFGRINENRRLHHCERDQ